MEVPSRATLLLMTYPLSMESVKVQLELLPFGQLGCLYLNEQTVLIKTAASRTVHKELRNTIITPPTAQLKFNAKLVDVLEWKEIYRMQYPFRATLDTKSNEFQYKLLGRCLLSNAFLFKV